MRTLVLSLAATTVLATQPPRFELIQPKLFSAGGVFVNAWADYDNDDDPDVFVGFNGAPNRLYRNDKGTFTDVAAATGVADARAVRAAAWGDFDADGDADLLVGNMDGDANGLFVNDAGRFTDAAQRMGVAWGGRTPKDAAGGTVRPCAADVNNDGRIDLFMANYGKNGLFLNNGAGFDDRSAVWGIDIDARHDTCAFADADNDGRLDLYANGTITGGVQYPDYLFRNTGARYDEGTPENVKALAADHGASWADVDGDGAIDLALTGSQATGMHSILRNLLPADQARRFIAVRVVDARGHATRAGAEVRVYAAGTRRLIATGLVDSGSGYDMQNDLPVHLGIGVATRVDVEVTWPANGTREVTRARSLRPGERRTIRTR